MGNVNVGSQAKTQQLTLPGAAQPPASPKPNPASQTQSAPSAPQTKPVQQTQPSRPQDKVQVAPQGTPQSTVPFVDANAPVDPKLALAETLAITDPVARAERFDDVLADLIEDKNYDGAIELFKGADADKQLPSAARTNMYKVLTQSLLETDLHDKAIELNATHSDPQVKDAVRQDIVKYLISEGQTIKAAQVRGEGTLTGVAKAELESLADSARTLGEDIYESWRRTVIGMNLGEKIADIARDDAEAGKKYRQAFLDYGNLACAHTISRILDDTRFDKSVDSNECNTLHAQLKDSGFTQVAGNRQMSPVARNFDYKEGDIVFFTRKNKGGYGHVGVVAKVEGDKVWMVHNSSSKRQVVQVPLNTYQRPVVTVMRPPEK